MRDKPQAGCRDDALLVRNTLRRIPSTLFLQAVRQTSIARIFVWFLCGLMKDTRHMFRCRIRWTPVCTYYLGREYVLKTYNTKSDNPRRLTRVARGETKRWVCILCLLYLVLLVVLLFCSYIVQEYILIFQMSYVQDIWLRVRSNIRSDPETGTHLTTIYTYDIAYGQNLCRACSNCTIPVRQESGTQLLTTVVGIYDEWEKYIPGVYT